MSEKNADAKKPDNVIKGPWKSNRIKVLKKYVNRMFVIFPFEKDFYANYGYNVEYYGTRFLTGYCICNRIP